MWILKFEMHRCTKESLVARSLTTRGELSQPKRVQTNRSKDNWLVTVRVYIQAQAWPRDQSLCRVFERSVNRRVKLDVSGFGERTNFVSIEPRAPDNGNPFGGMEWQRETLLISWKAEWNWSKTTLGERVNNRIGPVRSNLFPLSTGTRKPTKLESNSSPARSPTFYRTQLQLRKSHVSAGPVPLDVIETFCTPTEEKFHAFLSAIALERIYPTLEVLGHLVF